LKFLFIVTAAFETVTGVALVALPLQLVPLLGESLDTLASIVVARVMGVALVSLGVAC
jgi:hypothetical protein